MLRNVRATPLKGGNMKDERTVILPNQITIGEVMYYQSIPNPKEPYLAITKDGVYSFSNKEEAQAFANARGGFFDTNNICQSNRAKNRPGQRRAKAR